MRWRGRASCSISRGCLDEQYDLVVLGGGLSGLAAAYFHQKLHGPDARILVLDNHDDFGWLHNSTGLKPATWFDRQTYGKDVLLPGLLPDELSPRELAARVDEFPISESARSALRHFLLSEQDVLAGMTEKEKLAYLHGASYRNSCVSISTCRTKWYRCSADSPWVTRACAPRTCP